MEQDGYGAVWGRVVQCGAMWLREQTQGARRVRVLITVPFFESFYAVHFLVSEEGGGRGKDR